MGESVLVTGGAGFIGSHVAEKLIDRGYDVSIVDNLSGGYIENIPQGCTFYKENCEDYEAMKQVFNSCKPLYVMHLAAYAAEGLSHFVRRYNYINNLMASVNIINLCVLHKVKHLVSASSMSVYGSNVVPFHEDLPYNPEDVYAISKQAVEQDIKCANALWGLPFTIVRPHNCYSDDTEILTENGFKLFKDLTNNEKVATLNVDTNEIEYHIPDNYQKLKYTGKMYNFFGESYDLLVTPDHNLVMKKYGKDKHFFNLQAEEIVKNPDVYYHSVMVRGGNSWKGEDIATFSIPEIKDVLGRSMNNDHQNGKEKIVNMEDWMEFLGWFISEGCLIETPSNFVVSISQYKEVHPKEYQKIIDVIKRLGFEPFCSKDGKQIDVFSKQLYMLLNKFFPVSGFKAKHIPREFLNLSPKYLNRLWESLMLGDGTKHKDGTFARYNTSSPQLSSDIMELLLKLGLGGTIATDSSPHEKNPNWSTRYLIGVSRHRFCPQIGNNRTKKINVKEQNYDGFVYDVTVKNHVIFVRRNGKGVWGSNCVGPKQNIWDTYRNVVSIFIKQSLTNQPMTVFGDGSQQRAFSHIDDVATPIVDSISGIYPQFLNNTFNIGGDYPCTIEELAQTVKKVAKEVDNKDAVIDYLPPRYEVHIAYSTHDKLRKFYSYKSGKALYDMVLELYLWAKQQPEREMFTWKKADIEIMEKLPPKWEKTLK